MVILLAIWKFLKLVCWFCKDNWKVVLPVIAILVLGLWVRSCWSSHKAKLDEREIQEAKQAIQQNNDEKLKEVFAKADAKQAVIDGTVANAEANTKQAEAEAKKKYDAMTLDELAAELEARSKE